LIKGDDIVDEEME